jgi:hypothetical protein
MRNFPLSAVGGPFKALMRQPQWVAVFLSVGFHGALFAAGPSFSSLNMSALGGDAPEVERREVPLVELTPEEQSRLPDFSSSAFSPFSTEGTPFELLPPLASNPPSGNLSPQGTPQRNSVPPSPFGSRSTLLPGLSPYRSSLPSTGRSTITLPSGISPPRTPRAAAPSGGQKPVSGENSSAANGASTPTTESADGPSTDASDLLPRVAINQPDTESNEDSLPLAEGEAPSSESAAPAVPEQLAAFTYDATGTTETETAEAIESWQARVEEQFPGELTTAEEPLEVTVPYQGNLCLSPEPSEGLLGLALLPKTSEAGETEMALSTTVLKSTGYSFLNEAAATSMGTLEPGTIQPGVLYQARVNVDYDGENCTPPEDLLRKVTSDESAATEGASPTASEPSAPGNSAADTDNSDADAESAPGSGSTPNAAGGDAANNSTPAQQPVE